MISLIHIQPITGKCAVCEETKICHANDLELGLICDECFEPTVEADHVLQVTKGICRPQR